jgi:hypothetical protein
MTNIKSFENLNFNNPEIKQKGLEIIKDLKKVKSRLRESLPN